jgi:hypothetical protein
VQQYPPRVLLVMPDRWHRALLRAQLRELGYDALGAPDLAGGLLYPAPEPERGPVALIVVDQAVPSIPKNPLTWLANSW